MARWRQARGPRDAPAPAPFRAAPACTSANITESAPAPGAWAAERNAMLLFPSLHYCAACDVQWRGGPECWCCGRTAAIPSTT